jgi:hypothetical protein
MIVKDSGTLTSRSCGQFYYEIEYDGLDPNDEAYVPDWRIRHVTVDNRGGTCPARTIVYVPGTAPTPTIDRTWQPGTIETFNIPPGQNYRMDTVRYSVLWE